MNIERPLGRAARLASATSRALVLSAALAGALVAGCADENDPQTWVKRLDEPAQRTAAIKRLSQFFEDGMNKANKDRENADLKALNDKMVEPLTKQYTSGALDEKTRKELMKLLADTRDPRTAPALAKAFSDYEPGKNDEDVKFASQSIMGMAQSGKKTDPMLADALWNCFAKFQASKTRSLNLIKDLHDAVLAVKDPSFGPKAVEKISAPVDPKNPDQFNDQIKFWQTTAIQVIGEVKFTPAVKPLVQILLTPSKEALRSTANSALMKMPVEAERELVAALSGKNADYEKLAVAFGPEKVHVGILADSVAWISWPAGRDAVLEALASADNDANRTVLAQALYRFPSDPRVIPAFLDAYKKIPANTHVALLGGDFARANLAMASANLYDPNLVDWLLKEMKSASGDEVDALHLFSLESAIKLMTTDKLTAVNEGLKLGTPREIDMYTRAAAIVNMCTSNANCYVEVLDAAIPSSPKTANMGAVKAAYMAAIFGNADTAKALASRVDKVKDAGTRLAMVSAIDRLLPKGDAAVADTLDKVVEGDKASGNQSLLLADDSVVKVALRLRARALN